jgi:hypothetical protein
VSGPRWRARASRQARARAMLGAQAALLGSHFLASWGWRTWEFAVALLLSELYPGARGRALGRARPRLVV